MGERIKITLKKSQCIGCGTCAAICPKFFEMKNGIANLKNSKENNGELEIEANVNQDDLSCVEQAERYCSTKSININKTLL